MPLYIVRQDITKMKVDAIVNAANPTLLGGGGVDGAIHAMAGGGLLRECRTLGGCRTGDAKITGGYCLPCKYVIHAVGPVWHGGEHGEQALLESCYRRSLSLALENGCESVAFPLISSGAYGYPKDAALKVAMDVIGGFLLEHDMTVYIAVFDKKTFQISEKLFADIREYIDDHYADAHCDANCVRMESLPQSCRETAASAAPQLSEADNAGWLFPELDESFSQMLLRKIDERGMSDAACYKKANVDRKLFSKIRKDAQYKPSKSTAIAFAIALELSLCETEELLKKAGYALSHSYQFDVIIEYFIKTGNYNIFEINEALFAFDQNLLGV